ncbi:hypothetical protein [Psychrobacter immobilis]|uniref:hypothetical protein n=1 Tax=Psychrobacter immobilis TaxID=498 RepID=UPI0019182C50|nr:hypothetical protein [Psychrobacter immobilis]
MQTGTAAPLVKQKAVGGQTSAAMAPADTTFMSIVAKVACQQQAAQNAYRHLKALVAAQAL